MTTGRASPWATALTSPETVTGTSRSPSAGASATFMTAGGSMIPGLRAAIGRRVSRPVVVLRSVTIRSRMPVVPRKMITRNCTLRFWPGASVNRVGLESTSASGRLVSAIVHVARAAPTLVNVRVTVRLTVTRFSARPGTLRSRAAIGSRSPSIASGSTPSA